MKSIEQTLWRNQKWSESMPDYSALLSAISDVGCWRWWSERLPALFQLEFGGATYWRSYWEKRGTTEALPIDFACEVTIPIQQE